MTPRPCFLYNYIKEFNRVIRLALHRGKPVNKNHHREPLPGTRLNEKRSLFSERRAVPLPTPKRKCMTKRSAKPMRTGALIFFVVLLCSTAHGGPRFVDNGDGTVTDNKLGVMWAKTDNQGDIDWKEAQAFAKSKYGTTISTKYNNWRLPTLEELQSLYIQKPNYNGYPTDCGIEVKIAPALQLSCILIWASDTALGSHMAFNFNIGSSFTVPSYDISGCRVLPVRTIK